MNNLQTYNTLIDFINKFTLNQALKDTLIEGLNCIQLESFNAWSPNVTPIMPPDSLAGQPMATYQNIMNQVPSQPTAVSGGGDTGPDNHVANAEVSRDIAEETNKDWQNAPKFKQIHTSQSNPVKKMIMAARQHIPFGAENLYTLTGAGSMVSGIASANFNNDVNRIQGGSVGAISTPTNGYQ